MFEIIDNEGVIYSGNEEEMIQKFNDLCKGKESFDWKGDLKLVEVIDIYN